MNELQQRIDWGVKIFVTFLTPNHLKLLLEAIREGLERKQFSKSDFIFVSSSSLGDQLHLVRKHTREIHIDLNLRCVYVSVQ